MKRKRSGQSMMEFALVILIFLNLLVISYNSVVAFGVQQYFAYVAFLSARALEASGESPADQTERARKVISRFIPGPTLSFSGSSRPIAKNIVTFVPEAANIPYGMKGPQADREVRITFEAPLFELPFFSLSDRFPTLKLESKSYLGREATRTECRTFFKKFYEFFLPTGIPNRGARGVADGWAGMDDNDC